VTKKNVNRKFRTISKCFQDMGVKFNTGILNLIRLKSVLRVFINILYLIIGHEIDHRVVDNVFGWRLYVREKYF